MLSACTDDTSSGSGANTPPSVLPPTAPPGTGNVPPGTPGTPPPPPPPPPGNPPPPPPDSGTDADATADPPDSGTPPPDSGGPTAPVITADDKSGITPCPSQALLTSSASFATLKTAMQTGAIAYRDLPYSAADPDILKKKCGLGAFWDPAVNVDLIPVTGTPLLATILASGNGGICSTNFTTFGTDEGFAAAGTYRKEFQATSGGTTYRVRARIVAGGSGAGAKFSSFPISNADIQNTLVYEVNGSVTTHANLWSGLLGAMTAPVPAANLVVKRSGTAIFNSSIELICAAAL